MSDCDSGCFMEKASTLALFICVLLPVSTLLYIWLYFELVRVAGAGFFSAEGFRLGCSSDFCTAVLTSVGDAAVVLTFLSGVGEKVGLTFLSGFGEAVGVTFLPSVGDEVCLAILSGGGDPGLPAVLSGVAVPGVRAPLSGVAVPGVRAVLSRVGEAAPLLGVDAPVLSRVGEAAPLLGVDAPVLTVLFYVGDPTLAPRSGDRLRTTGCCRPVFIFLFSGDMARV